MAAVIWDPEAEHDLREIAYFIGVQRGSPLAARCLIDSIRQKCALYASHPEMGQERPDFEPGIRVFRVGNHVVLYFPRTDGIYVVRIFEGHIDYPDVFSPRP